MSKALGISTFQAFDMFSIPKEDVVNVKKDWKTGDKFMVNPELITAPNYKGRTCAQMSDMFSLRGSQGEVLMVTNTGHIIDTFNRYFWRPEWLIPV